MLENSGFFLVSQAVRELGPPEGAAGAISSDAFFEMQNLIERREPLEGPTPTPQPGNRTTV